jgi:hypothetical protein
MSPAEQYGPDCLTCAFRMPMFDPGNSYGENTRLPRLSGHDCACPVWCVDGKQHATLGPGPLRLYSRSEAPK